MTITGYRAHLAVSGCAGVPTLGARECVESHLFFGCFGPLLRVLDRALSWLDAGYWIPGGELQVQRLATVQLQFEVSRTSKKDIW